ncbi:MAG: cation diffusion facilitator family transporter [Burkholderiales bacterium]
MASHFGHSHDHVHGHVPTATNGLHMLIVALLATLAFGLIEIATGRLFGSLALISDGGHMLSDGMALALAVLAAWISARPAGARHSYGFARAEVIAGFVNGLAMLLVVIWIVVEAVERLLAPPAVAGLGVMLVALAGLLLNLAVAYLIGRGGQSLNRRAILLHVMADAIASVAALLSGAVIYFTGWRPIDALLSIVIALLILFSTLRLLRDALHVLMEGVPSGLDLPEIGRALSGIGGVHSVHDLHVWNIASGQVALSAHMEVGDFSRWEIILESARSLLGNRYSIHHVTLQPELIGGINRRFTARIKIVPSETSPPAHGAHSE